MKIKGQLVVLRRDKKIGKWIRFYNYIFLSMVILVVIGSIITSMLHK